MDNEKKMISFFKGSELESSIQIRLEKGERVFFSGIKLSNIGFQAVKKGEKSFYILRQQGNDFFSSERQKFCEKGFIIFDFFLVLVEGVRVNVEADSLNSHEPGDIVDLFAFLDTGSDGVLRVKFMIL